MRRVSAVLAAFVVLAGLAACGSQPSQQHLIIGFKTDLLGISEYADGTGSFVGVDPAVANSIAKSMGVTYSAAPVTRSDWQQALNDPSGTDHVDLVISAISYTDLRARSVDMAYSYMKTDLGVLTRTDSGIRITSESDLKNYRVCALADSTAASEMTSIHIDPTEPQDEKDCLDDLKNKTTDAVVDDRLVLMGIVADNEYSSVFSLSGVDFGKYQYYVIAVPQHQHDLCEKVVSALHDYVGTDQWVADFKNNLTTTLSAGQVQADFSTKNEVTDRYCGS